MNKFSIEEVIKVLEAERSDLSTKQLEQFVGLTRSSESVREGISDTLEATEKCEPTPEQKAEFFAVFENRFNNQFDHYRRPENITFDEVKATLDQNPNAIYSLTKMEETHGNPDIIIVEKSFIVFADCSFQSPRGRRNVNYEQAVLMAERFGVDMVCDELYCTMNNKIGLFDKNTQSWLKTPKHPLESGKAFVGDNNYHYTRINALDSCQKSPDTGWRGVLRIPRV